MIMWFMYGVAAISTLMNLIELNYLLSHWVSTRLQALRDRRIAMKRSMAMNTNSGGPRETLANGNGGVIQTIEQDNLYFEVFHLVQGIN